jgi:3-oxoacyl-[acyl-carrier protein] reductase
MVLAWGARDGTAACDARYLRGMQTDLAGLAVFVTGASGGIGRAIARAFAAEGCRLALAGNTRTAELAELARNEGWDADAEFLSFDATDPGETDRAFATARERFGRIDVAVACAGHWPSANQPLHDLADERIAATIARNLLAPTYTLRAFARGLVTDGPRADRRGANAVLIGSTAARFGERGHADYALAKAGLHGLMLTLKNEWPRIDPRARVNLVEPGWTATEIPRAALADDRLVGRAVRTMALRQLASAEDVARAVVMLASPSLSRHITGQVVTVAGGMEGRTLWDEHEIDAEDVRRRSSGTHRP